MKLPPSVLNRSPVPSINSRGETNACICHDGCWWFVSCSPPRAIRLDPLLRRHSWNVGELCRVLGIAQRTLGRVVERSVGLSTKTWLRRHRIVAACHLLREGWKIEALSKDFGFSHSSAFTREFKTLVGVTPSLFIRMETERFFLPPHDEVD